MLCWIAKFWNVLELFTPVQNNYKQESEGADILGNLLNWWHWCFQLLDSKLINKKICLFFFSFFQTDRTIVYVQSARTHRHNICSLLYLSTYTFWKPTLICAMDLFCFDFCLLSCYVTLSVNSTYIHSVNYVKAAFTLTFAVASIFSGSTRVRSRPINCTAPPSSGSVSQIMCSMIRLIKRMSWKANNYEFMCTIVINGHRSHLSCCLCVYTYIIILLWFLHDELSYHGGVVFHQIREDICGCPTHLNIVHSLFKINICIIFISRFLICTPGNFEMYFKIVQKE